MCEQARSLAETPLVCGPELCSKNENLVEHRDRKCERYPDDTPRCDTSDLHEPMKTSPRRRSSIRVRRSGPTGFRQSKFHETRDLEPAESAWTVRWTKAAHSYSASLPG